ncbi:hypothetical protein V3C99_006356 [Haemonchus contortus]
MLELKRRRREILAAATRPLASLPEDIDPQSGYTHGPPEARRQKPLRPSRASPDGAASRSSRGQQPRRRLNVVLLETDSCQQPATTDVTRKQVVRPSAAMQLLFIASSYITE